MCGGRKIIPPVNGRFIYQYVYAPPFFDEPSRHSLHPQAIGYRNHGVKSPPAIVFDFPADLLGKIDTLTIVERHVGTFTCKHFAERRTNTARSPCDERSLSLKQKAH